MARYRFHCTNGSECFFDARGTDIRVPARLAIRAQQVARELMRTRVEAADWSDWRVAVCDLNEKNAADLAEAPVCALDAIAEWRAKQRSVAGEWKGWKLQVCDRSGAVLVSIKLDALSE